MKDPNHYYIRKFIKNDKNWTDEIDAIESIQFHSMFDLANGNHRTVYYVLVTHEYSRETQTELIRVLFDSDKIIRGCERVYLS